MLLLTQRLVTLFCSETTLPTTSPTISTMLHYQQFKNIKDVLEFHVVTTVLVV